MDYFLHEPAWGIRNRILRFTPGWYSVIMGTGILSNLLFEIPYHTHNVLRIMSGILLCLNLALFFLFTTFTVTRYIMFPKILKAVTQNETHSMFLGTIPMAIVTLTSGLHNHGLALDLSFTIPLTLALWYISAFLSALIVTTVPYFMSTRQRHTPQGMTALWLLPIVPPITVSATASLLIPTLYNSTNPIYQTHAHILLLTGYAFDGIGVLLALTILTLYFQRLAHHSLPPKHLLITVFLPLGPCGQGGFALIRLGRAASLVYANSSVSVLGDVGENVKDGSGDLSLRELSRAMYGAGVVGGAMLWGLGMWWAVVAMLTLIPKFWPSSPGQLKFFKFNFDWLKNSQRRGKKNQSQVRKREERDFDGDEKERQKEKEKENIEFSMGWWSFTFPLGSLSLLTFALGDTLDSPFFRVCGTIFTSIVGFFFLVVSGPTIRGFVKGDLFQAPCLAAVERGYGLTEKERRRLFGFQDSGLERQQQQAEEVGMEEMTVECDQTSDVGRAGCGMRGQLEEEVIVVKERMDQKPTNQDV